MYRARIDEKTCDSCSTKDGSAMTAPNHNCANLHTEIGCRCKNVSNSLVLVKLRESLEEIKLEAGDPHLRKDGEKHFDSLMQGFEAAIEIVEEVERKENIVRIAHLYGPDCTLEDVIEQLRVILSSAVIDAARIVRCTKFNVEHENSKEIQLLIEVVCERVIEGIQLLNAK